jgi:DNA-binding NarL/FixJ family response regulator
MLVSTVAVCDTEPIAMEGLCGLLESNLGARVVAAETAIEEGIAIVRKMRPSLLIIDRCFGTNAVMDCIRLLRTEKLPTAMIVWGNPISEAEALRFVQAGANGVVRKTAAVADVLTCVRSVLAGGAWMESKLLAKEPATLVRSGRSGLTAREVQVMELVERGLKNKEIGEALGIQTGTVKIHLKHIFEKTGIRGRYGLALNGLKQKGLIGAGSADPGVLDTSVEDTGQSLIEHHGGGAA